jgi:hypothetical protein
MMQKTLIAGLLVTWLVCYFATFRSVSSIAAATKFTVIVAWFLLAVFTIHKVMRGQMQRGRSSSPSVSL